MQWIDKDSFDSLLSKSHNSVVHCILLCCTFEDTKKYKPFVRNNIKLFPIYATNPYLERSTRGISSEFLLVEDGVSEKALQTVLYGVVPTMAHFNQNITENIYYIKG